MKREKTVGKRRRHSAEFKVKVVLAALREDKTESQLASEFGIHPLQITAWKKQAVETMPEGFGARRQRTAAEQAEDDGMARVGMTAGRYTVEALLG